MTPHFPAVTAAEMVAVLLKIGFRLKRHTGGSHAVYYRDGDRKRTVVPMHGGRVLKRKTVQAILTDAGIDREEFLALLR